MVDQLMLGANEIDLNDTKPLKLTFSHLKMGAPWKRKFPLETTIFRCHVSFREGIYVCIYPIFPNTQWGW